MTITVVDPLLSLTTMTASGCLPCQERAAQSVAITPLQADSGRRAVKFAAPPAKNEPSFETASTAQRWSGVIGVEGELTGDGRLIEANALRWENLPLPLRYVSSDVGSHDGAVVVGRITEIHRAADGQIMGSGDFDATSVVGLEAIRQVAEGLTNGVSMDLDDVSFEVRVAEDLMGGEGGFPMFLSRLAAEDDPDAIDPEAPKADADGRIVVAEINSTDEVRVTTDGRIRAATIVAIPAFAGAQIHLADASDEDSVPVAAGATVGLLPDGDTECSCTEGEPNYDPECNCDPEESEVQDLAALVAGAAPVEPPAAWFEMPRFTGPTPMKVTKDGQVYGHIALWGTCHATHAQEGQCVPPPHSASNYSRFHYGALLTAEGTEIAVGHLTMDTRHASKDASPFGAVDHYERTGTVAADVRAYEDEWGIAVAGAIRPEMTAAQIRAFRAAPISGDWRRIGYDLELHAALAVNVPGFGVPRPAGLVAGGTVQSLVAAGMLPPGLIVQPGTRNALSEDDLMYLKRLADRERAEEASLVASGHRDTATSLARRVRASALKLRAHAR